MARHAAVAITSLLDVSKERCDYNIYCVVDKGVSDKDKSMLCDFVKNSSSSLTFLDANNDFENSYVGYWVPAIYNRLMLPKLLPDIKEIIYADVDGVFCDDLAAAANIDLKDNLIAGVIDCKSHIKGIKSYINSGFLIMNLAQIRKEKIYEKWIEVSRQGPFKLPDQDVLNIVCKDRILLLPLKYNLVPGKIGYSEEELHDRKYHAVFLHYANFAKPWRKYKPYLSKIWWHYAKQTGLF